MHAQHSRAYSTVGVHMDTPFDARDGALSAVAATAARARACLSA